MSSDPSASPANDPNLSGLGRALLDTDGSKPSTGPWVPPAAEDLGKLLPEYDIVKMLGRGGMGAVYMGRQISLDRPVAIKILSNTLDEADASFAERFKNEARAMGKLNHPGIVSVYAFGETAGGLLYIVMEYIEGTDVARMIAKSGRLHTQHAMAITAHVCDALAYAHERGIIHRDIKPANIMVGYDGEVKVADFGLAKVSTSGQTLGLTQSGMAMGTLHFMAPEALMLGTAVDHRADIYAVGVMLFQMLTGKVPHGMFKMPSLQVAGLDPRYDGVIAKAMMEDRELRYQSAREMRAGLDGILTQPVIKVEPAPAGAAPPAAAALPTQARPQRPGGPVRQPYRPPQSRPVVQTQKRGSLMYWVAVLVLGAAVAWMLLDREKQIAPAATAQETATTTSAPTKTAASDTPSVPAPLPPVPNAPSAPAQPAAAPVINAYAWLIGTWIQSYGTPPTPALSMALRADYTAEMTAGGKTVQGRWNLSGKKLGINWANGYLHEIVVSTPDAVTELTGKGTPPQGGSFPLIYRKGVPPPVPSAAVATIPTPPMPASVPAVNTSKPATPAVARSLKDVLVGRWKVGPTSEWAYEFGADKILTIHTSNGVPRLHQWTMEGESVVWNSYGGLNKLDFQPPGTLRGTTSRGVAMVLERVGDLPAPAASATLWIDAQKRTLKASFVRLEGDKVWLDIAGKKTPLPLASLSDESRKIATALHAASSSATPRSGDPRPVALAKDLSIVKVSLGAAPLSAGARLGFSAAVKNGSSAPVILPFSERAAVHGVSYQLWIERLGRNKEIPSFQSGKKGDWYAAGGNQVSLRAGESVLQAGEEMMFRQPILTQGFPAGKYRIHVELEPMDSEEVFTQSELDFELTP